MAASSGGTPGSPSGSDDQLPMRNAVAQVFLAHKSELPVSVKDGAVRALGSPGFVGELQGRVSQTGIAASGRFLRA